MELSEVIGRKGFWISKLAPDAPFSRISKKVSEIVRALSGRALGRDTIARQTAFIQSTAYLKIKWTVNCLIIKFAVQFFEQKALVPTF